MCGYATGRITNYKHHIKQVVISCTQNKYSRIISQFFNSSKMQMEIVLQVHLKDRTVCHLCGKEYSNINQVTDNKCCGGSFRCVPLAQAILQLICGVKINLFFSPQHLRVVHKTLKSGMTKQEKCHLCHQDYYDLLQHQRRAHKVPFIYLYH
jgi:hypothetical protein